VTERRFWFVANGKPVRSTSWRCNILDTKDASDNPTDFDIMRREYQNA
jgi:hypothetical protein